MKPRMESFMGKAVYDIEISTPADEVVDKVYRILNVRSNSLTKNVAFMPNPLPEVPGMPQVAVKSMGMGMAGTFAFPQCSCDNAYAIMNGYDKGVSSIQFGSSDRATYTACIYPYQDNYRVYIIGLYQTTSQGGIGGLVYEGVKKGVTTGLGKDNMFASWFAQVVDEFEKTFPDASRIEVAMP
jgi:hypothetical protein